MAELLGLPPHRDVDFIIELHSSTSPISMTPHRIVPTPSLRKIMRII